MPYRSKKLAVFSVLLLASCAETKPAANGADKDIAPSATAIGEQEKSGAKPPETESATASKKTADASENAEDGIGDSLAFEWSANGFEDLPASFTWTGNSRRDDGFQPHLTLSVPETDDAVWASECLPGSRVKTQLYLAPPADLKGSKAELLFEADTAAKVRRYPAQYVATGQYDGFEIVQNASDPMFADMKKGQWAFLQIGTGDKATKLRIPLTDVGPALAAFLPACAS